MHKYNASTILIFFIIFNVLAQENNSKKAIPFAVLEKPFIFPGCESESLQQIKACTNSKISLFINDNLNRNIANDVGLEGKVRVSLRFKVDTDGNIFDIKVEAPHPKLEIECERVINSLPKFKPSTYNGELVETVYSLPIAFQVVNSTINQTDLWGFNLGRLQKTSTIYIDKDDYYLFGRGLGNGLEVYRLPHDGSKGNALSNIRTGSYGILSRLPESIQNNNSSIVGLTYNVTLNKEVINIDFSGSISEFEWNNRSSVETFERIHGLKENKNYSTYFAKSTYTNRTYLFIEEIVGGKRKKIDITANNPDIIYDNSGATIIKDNLGNRWNNFQIISYTNSQGKDYVVFSTQQTGIFYYIIENGVVEKINKAEFKNTEYLEKVYFLEYSGLFINQIKTNYGCNNCYRLEAVDKSGKKIWSKNIPDSYKINSIVENNGNVVVGGSNTKVGYLGYPNPYIELLDNKTGKLKNSYFKAEKNISINNMATLDNNRILITTGMAEGLSTIEDTDNLRVTVYKNAISSNGQFLKTWFTKIEN
ncbi:energy transducer TonB [Bizionia sp.]|uniref:energy transducer TonB n=1 Tax=Bizionia sp. TaxID=1954480 RepID=UPI003A92BF1E